MTKREFMTRINGCAERSFYAEETRQQLLGRNPMIAFSWGIDKMQKIKSEHYPEEDGALLFSVNGAKFKGYVLITLAFSDLYQVRFFTKDYTHYEEQKTLQLDEVYCDDLTFRIDEVVETTQFV